MTFTPTPPPMSPTPPGPLVEMTGGALGYQGYLLTAYPQLLNPIPTPLNGAALTTGIQSFMPTWDNFIVPVSANAVQAWRLGGATISGIILAVVMIAIFMRFRKFISTNAPKNPDQLLRFLATGGNPNLAKDYDQRKEHDAMMGRLTAEKHRIEAAKRNGESSR